MTFSGSLVALLVVVLAFSSAHAQCSASPLISYDIPSNLSFPYAPTAATVIYNESLGSDGTICGDFSVNKSIYLKNFDHSVAGSMNLVSNELSAVCSYADSDYYLCGRSAPAGCNLTVGEDLTIEGSSGLQINVNGSVTVQGSLTLSSTSTLTMKVKSTLTIHGDFHAYGTMRIDPTAQITVDGCIYLNNETSLLRFLVPVCYTAPATAVAVITSLSNCVDGSFGENRVIVVNPTVDNYNIREYVPPNETDIYNFGLGKDTDPILFNGSAEIPPRGTNTAGFGPPPPPPPPPPAGSTCNMGSIIGVIFGATTCPPPPPPPIRTPTPTFGAILIEYAPPIDPVFVPSPPTPVVDIIIINIPIEIEETRITAPSPIAQPVVPRTPTSVPTPAAIEAAAESADILADESTRTLVTIVLPVMAGAILLVILFVVLAVKMKWLRRSVTPFKDRDSIVIPRGSSSTADRGSFASMGDTSSLPDPLAYSPVAVVSGSAPPTPPVTQPSTPYGTNNTYNTNTNTLPPPPARASVLPPPPPTATFQRTSTLPPPPPPRQNGAPILPPPPPRSYHQ